VAVVIGWHWQRKAAIDHQWSALAAIGGDGVIFVKSRDDRLALSFIDREREE
jgi:hypothetical protein